MKSLSQKLILILLTINNIKGIIMKTFREMATDPSDIAYDMIRKLAPKTIKATKLPDGNIILAEYDGDSLRDGCVLTHKDSAYTFYYYNLNDADVIQGNLSKITKSITDAGYEEILPLIKK
jgi:hypothetical protein